MKLILCSLLAFGLTIIAPTSSWAQLAKEDEDVLEQRVVEELARSGTSLSGLDVALDIEIIGDKAIVSLVDSATRRARASTKLDAIPADLDAAVALAVKAAAELVVQLPQAAAASAKAPVSVDPRPDDDRQRPRDDDRKLEVAEQRYRRDAIGFGDEIIVTAYNNVVNTSRRWFAHRGELKIELEGDEFYRLVSRPDLAEAYDDRMTYAKVGFGVSAVALGLSLYLFYLSKTVEGDHKSCTPDDYVCNVDNDLADLDAQQPYFYASMGGLLGSGLAFLVGRYYWRNPHPISESEAKSLASEYNQLMRVRLGLPTASRAQRTPFHGIAITPQLGAHGGGLGLTARF